MTATTFFRMADRLATLPPTVRAIAELLATGDAAAAERAAGERGSPEWWAAEFFLAQLADHGAAAAPARRGAAAPRTAALFAD